MLDKVKERQGHVEGEASTTTSASSPTTRHQDALPVHPGLDREVREAVGHEHRDGGPRPRRQAGEEAPRQGRRRRPLARRHDDDRVRDLGLRGRAGAEGLSGLVFIDGASRTEPASTTDAQAALDRLNADSASPWLTFGGIAAPFTGLFNATGALGAILDPDSPSVGQAFPSSPPTSRRRCR